MKNPFYTLAVSFLFTGIIFTSCCTPADKVNASKANVEKAELDLELAKQDYNEEYNQFKLESEGKITANEKLIADLKAYSKNKKKETKDEYDRIVNDLEAKNQAMKDKMNGYKEDGNNKWESFKNEFNHDMSEIGKSLNDLGKNNVK